VIPTGGLSPDRVRWIPSHPSFFLPKDALSVVFRGKFVDGLEAAFKRRKLVLAGSVQPLANEKLFRAFVRSLYRHRWIVYVKPPFGGPHHVLRYLARYNIASRSPTAV
jgi:hypothetical protein